MRPLCSPGVMNTCGAFSGESGIESLFSEFTFVFGLSLPIERNICIELSEVKLWPVYFLSVKLLSMCHA